MVTIIERQKALGFNLVRLPFSFVDLNSPPKNAQYGCSGSNPDACGIVQSVLKPGQDIPPGALWLGRLFTASTLEPNLSHPRQDEKVAISCGLGAGDKFVALPSSWP